MFFIKDCCWKFQQLRQGPGWTRFTRSSFGLFLSLVVNALKREIHQEGSLVSANRTEDRLPLKGIVRIRNSKSFLEPELAKYVLRHYSGGFRNRVPKSFTSPIFQTCVDHSLREALAGETLVNGQHEQMQIPSRHDLPIPPVLLIESLEHRENRQKLFAA